MPSPRPGMSTALNDPARCHDEADSQHKVQTGLDCPPCFPPISRRWVSELGDGAAYPGEAHGLSCPAAQPNPGGATPPFPSLRWRGELKERREAKSRPGCKHHPPASAVIGREAGDLLGPSLPAWHGPSKPAGIWLLGVCPGSIEGGEDALQKQEKEAENHSPKRSCFSCVIFWAFAWLAPPLSRPWEGPRVIDPLLNPSPPIPVP